MIAPMQNPEFAAFARRDGRFAWLVVGSWLALGAAAIAQPAPATPPAGGPGGAAVVGKIAPSAQALSAAGDTGWDARARAFGGFEWVTRPSRDAIMGFTVPMEVQEIAVVGGQRVKKGDLLIKGRDGEALATLEVQRVRAKNVSVIANAEAALELADLRFRDGERAFKENALTPAEFDERRVQVKSSTAALNNAKAQVDEETKRVKQLEEQLARYRLDAPFDGVVEIVACEVGQAVEQAQAVVRVVNTDPMWIDVPAPTEETLAMNLKQGDKAWVLLDVPSTPERGVLEAKVLDVSRVADASGSRRVRVEVPNPQQWPAGTRARVRFTSPESTPAGGAAAAPR